MGKSEKKAKLDRINALRKQYDAFLENERKRKERNEYILGKLEKMRFSDSLVKVKPTTAYLEINNANSSANFVDRYFVQHTAQPTEIKSSVCLVPKATEESLVLKELSKKYILIPRLTTTSVDNNANEIFAKNINNELGASNETFDNTDWKSKYDILNQLKKDEKGETEPIKLDHSQKNEDYEDRYEYTKDNITETRNEEIESLTKVEPTFYQNQERKLPEIDKRIKESKINPTFNEVEEPLKNNICDTNGQKIGRAIYQYETPVKDNELEKISETIGDLNPNKTIKLNHTENNDAVIDISEYQTDMKNKEFISSSTIPYQETMNTGPEEYEVQNSQAFTPDDQTNVTNAESFDNEANNEDVNNSIYNNHEETVKDINHITSVPRSTAAIYELPVKNENIESQRDAGEINEQAQQSARNTSVDYNYHYDTETNNAEVFHQNHQPIMDESSYQYGQGTTEGTVEAGSAPTPLALSDYQYDAQTNDINSVNEINNEANVDDSHYQYEYETHETVQNPDGVMMQNVRDPSAAESAFQYDYTETPITAPEYPSDNSYAQNLDTNYENGDLAYAGQENPEEFNETQNKNELYQYDANGQYQYYEGGEQYPTQGIEPQDNQYDPNYVQQYEGDYNYTQPEYAENNQEYGQVSETMQGMNENAIYEEGNTTQIPQQINEQGDVGVEQLNQVEYKKPDEK